MMTASCVVCPTCALTSEDGVAETVCCVCGMLRTVNCPSCCACDHVEARGDGSTNGVTVGSVSDTSVADRCGSDYSDRCHTETPYECPDGGLVGAEVAVVVTVEDCGMSEDATELHST